MSVLLQFSCLCRAEGLNAPPVFTYSAPPVRIKYKRLSYQIKLKICLVALALPVVLCAPARQGDRVEVAYGMELREEAVRGDSSRVALLYGPVVMAGCLGHVDSPFSDPSKHNDYYTFDYKVPAGLAGNTRIKGASCLKKNAPLDYTTPQGVRVKPFYDVHHERYVVYWNKTEK